MAHIESPIVPGFSKADKLPKFRDYHRILLPADSPLSSPTPVTLQTFLTTGANKTCLFPAEDAAKIVADEAPSVRLGLRKCVISNSMASFLMPNPFARNNYSHFPTPDTGLAERVRQILKILDRDPNSSKRVAGLLGQPSLDLFENPRRPDEHV